MNVPLIEYKPGTTVPGRMGRTVSESVLTSVRYTSPFPFTGTSSKVTVDASGKPDHDETEVKKAEAPAAMARQ
jgi:hypothetical protein